MQIGVTTTALLSSAFGAVTLSRLAVATGCATRAWRTASPTVSASSVVTLVIAYVTLVVGELAPKRIALQRAEGTAQRWSAPTLERFASADAAGHLAAVGVDRRRRAAARR